VDFSRFFIVVTLTQESLVRNSKNEALESIVYSYKHGFSGFAAMLTESQAETLASNTHSQYYILSMTLVVLPNSFKMFQLTF
jgi:hypothetical protein